MKYPMRALATTTLVALLVLSMIPTCCGFPIGLDRLSTSSTTIRVQPFHSPPLNLRHTRPSTKTSTTNRAVPSIPFPFTTTTIKEDQRYSANDWLHNMCTLPRSTILQEVKSPVTNLMVWSLVVSGLHRIVLLLQQNKFPGAGGNDFLSISSTPHSFLFSALGLLLVFRTNAAYQRFSEGRQIWEQILSVSRNLTRYTSLYQNDIGRARQWRMVRLLGAFPYLLQSRITALGDDNYSEDEDDNDEDDNDDDDDNRRRRSSSSSFGSNTKDHDDYDDGYTLGPSATTMGSHDRHPSSATTTTTTADTDTATTKLPWSLFPPKARAKCMASSNQPLWVCDRLAQEVIQVPVTSDHFTSRERTIFLSLIDKLTVCVGECERIHQTAVPQNYARHSLRSLTIWLWTLPFCLVQELGLWTVPVMGVTSWLLFGVYQIGASIEDPFKGSLRLRSLCDAIYRDVMFEELVVLDTDADDAGATSTSTADIVADNNDEDSTARSVTQLLVPTIKTNHRQSAFQMDDELQEWEALKTQSLTRR